MMCGVGRTSITMACKRGVLPDRDDKTMDLDDPKVKAYLEAHQSKMKAKKAAATAQPFLPLEAMPGGADDDLDSANAMLDERTRYTVAKRLQAEADTRYKNTRNAQLKGVLIPRELVRRQWARMDVSLKTYFRDMPRRISARLFAIARAEDEKAVETFLEQEFTAALTSVISDASKEGLA